MGKINGNKICHLTSVHPRYDTRIFIKECSSLVKQGYDVTLIVADGLGDEEYRELKIVDLGKPKSRLDRVAFWRKKFYKNAITQNAEIYHFHDPELLSVGRKLINEGKKVIYDVHEDVPRQILTKAYIPKIFRKIISSVFENYENNISSKLSGIVTATPFIRDRFSKFNDNVTEVQNFPLLQEFSEMPVSKIATKTNTVCYIGAITKVRGILMMVDAMKFTYDVELMLGGKFENTELREMAATRNGWNKVRELGFLSRTEVKETLARSAAGLVVLEPTVNYLDSIPVKMFEYMAAGIPVIASDFKYWRELIEKEECALFVDSYDPQAIGKAISILVHDKKRSLEMGRRGKRAVANRFNWQMEEGKLLGLYNRLS